MRARALRGRRLISQPRLKVPARLVVKRAARVVVKKAWAGSVVKKAWAGSVVGSGPAGEDDGLGREEAVGLVMVALVPAGE